MQLLNIVLAPDLVHTKSLCMQVHSVVYARSLCLVLGGVVCLLLLCLKYREQQTEADGNRLHHKLPATSFHHQPVAHSFCIMHVLDIYCVCKIATGLAALSLAQSPLHGIVIGA
jgi:hypothetical protein